MTILEFEQFQNTFNTRPCTLRLCIHVHWATGEEQLTLHSPSIPRDVAWGRDETRASSHHRRGASSTAPQAAPVASGWLKKYFLIVFQQYVISDPFVDQRQPQNVPSNYQLRPQNISFFNQPQLQAVPIISQSRPQTIPFLNQPQPQFVPIISQPQPETSYQFVDRSYFYPPEVQSPRSSGSGNNLATFFAILLLSGKAILHVLFIVIELICSFFSQSTSGLCNFCRNQL